MSEKRFIQLGDTHIKDTVTGEEWYAPCETSLLKLLNEQQDQISYWKHKVNSLLWILSQFDKEKVKELLKEVGE